MSDLVERLREPLVIEYAIPLPVSEVLQRAADERAEAADRIERLSRLLAEKDEALTKARNRFLAIGEFGDPDDISEDPEEFGGTDDGHETLCMAYDNMRGIAERGAEEISTALEAKERADG